MLTLSDCNDFDDEGSFWLMSTTLFHMFCVRVVYVQGENCKETEAWFNVLSKALQVGIFRRIQLCWEIYS